MTNRDRPEWRSAAHPDAVVRGDRFRVTVLTDAVVRVEWSEDGVFEDRPSTFAVTRDLPVPAYRVSRPGGLLQITTDRLELTYDGGPFSAAGLTVQARGNVTAYHSRWRYGEEVPGERGTARTLDEADGAVPLGPGVVSRNGIAVLDDSESFLFGNAGTVEARRAGTRDLYVFAHGRDYAGAVRDLYRISGATPVLPRWALGNWWSRYHAYSAESYLALLDEFAARGLPFSVSVIDMDWHRTEVDPRYGSGWTGYSWNRELFPDPAGFLRALHDRGLHVTLNVHPADGIRPFEDAHPEVAAALGVDADETVPFDLTDPGFVDAYFDLVHHPLEDEGVDFWWLDWQQGGHSRIPGVDPLWLLNHFHFLDSGRNGRRALTFSRYAGPGSHRYPVGFSGDTVISWASLDFQPYFTATASNIGYGWWSHDIGGHIFGGKDDALAARWVQLGAFSPINRLHSSSNPFIRKEPWTFGREAEAAMTAALRFRSRLVPYLHSMNARAALEGAPLVQPLYWGHPDAEEAYRFPNEYLFGTELIVAPITTPDDPDLLLGSVLAWLPEGRWVDLFTGLAYDGGRRVRLHRSLQDIPVLLRAGGIVPLALQPGGEASNPDALEILVAPGADGRFELREDAGEGDGRDPAAWATTVLAWTDGVLTIGAVEGAPSFVPGERSWRITILGAGEGTQARSDAVLLDPLVSAAGVSFELAAAPIGGARRVEVGPLVPQDRSRLLQRAFDMLDRAQVPFAAKNAADTALREAASTADAAARIVGLELGALGAALLELVLAEPGPADATPATARR